MRENRSKARAAGMLRTGGLIAAAAVAGVALPAAAWAQDGAAGGLKRPADASPLAQASGNDPLAQLNSQLDRFNEHVSHATCITPQLKNERIALLLARDEILRTLRRAEGNGVPIDPAVAQAYNALNDRVEAAGRDVYSHLKPCSAPPESATPPSPPPPPPPPPPVPHFYFGVGATYFFEPGTQFGLITGTAGYRITPNIGIELQGDVGVTKEKFDNGSTFKSSTGIDWSIYPMVTGYLPVGGSSELFLHGGYGWTRFGSKATSFSGSSSTSFEDHDTVGTGILGGGADIGLGDRASLRLQYDRLFFDNGSEGNRATATIIYQFSGPH
jgi:hypothetical protein